MPVDLDGFQEFKETLEGAMTDSDEEEMWVGSAMSYAPYVEFGTGPHTSSEGHEEFVQNITRWANQKGLPVWPIIQSIRAQGTEPHPHLRPAINKARAELGFMGINVFLPGGVNRLLRAWALKVVRETKKEAPVNNGTLRASYAIGESKDEMLQNSEQKVTEE